MYYSVTLSVTPVLLNPVRGASNKSIGSFYGDPRDAGKRKHEGIDIFAPKGTPVVAPSAGVVTRVGNSTLGGKTIWMNDLKRGHSYYFAHLDSQIVKAGVKVKQGDILGTVGNTGNARYTPSHLHFGVYQKESKDPVAYIRTMERLVNELAPDTLFQSVVFRAAKKSSDIFTGPSVKLPVREKIVKDTYVRVIAQSNDWYRVVTAENREGFIEKNKLVPAVKGVTLVIKKPTLFLTDAAVESVPMDTLTGAVEQLAAHKTYRFIKTKDGQTGWIDVRAK
jgi:murein DD-endopeptidase MepM/ murein hydrolase activator NlpD